MKFLKEMAEFAGKHWLGLSVLAAMTGGVLCFFFPPLLVSGFAMALASYPAFGAALGAYAGSAALAVMSGVVGFSALGVFAFIRNLADIVDGFVGLFKPKAKAFSEKVPPASGKVPPPSDSESKATFEPRRLFSDFESQEGIVASDDKQVSTTRDISLTESSGEEAAPKEDTNADNVLSSDSNGPVTTSLPQESSSQTENLIQHGIFSPAQVVSAVPVETLHIKGSAFH